jgi:hypothetical protein
MLLPTLVKDSNAAGAAAVLLPPRYEDNELLEEYNSSPFIFGWIETFFGEPARNDHEILFGKVGAAGPEVYRDSIKYQTWATVSLIVFWGLQIVARDIQALLEGWQVADIDLVRTELIIYGTYVVLAIGELVLAPQTFLNYCLVSSIENLADEYIIDEALCSIDKSQTISRLESVVSLDKKGDMTL